MNECSLWGVFFVSSEDLFVNETLFARCPLPSEEEVFDE